MQDSYTKGSYTFIRTIVMKSNSSLHSNIVGISFREYFSRL